MTVADADLYRSTYPLAERLEDLLRSAVATGRMSDEEADRISWVHLLQEACEESARLLEEDRERTRREVAHRAAGYEARMVELMDDHRRRKALELAGKLCPHIEPEAYAAWRRAQGMVA